MTDKNAAIYDAAENSNARRVGDSGSPQQQPAVALIENGVLRIGRTRELSSTYSGVADGEPVPAPALTPGGFENLIDAATTLYRGPAHQHSSLSPERAAVTGLGVVGGFRGDSSPGTVFSPEPPSVRKKDLVPVGQALSPDNSQYGGSPLIQKQEPAHSIGPPLTNVIGVPVVAPEDLVRLGGNDVSGAVSSEVGGSSGYARGNAAPVSSSSFAPPKIPGTAAIGISASDAASSTTAGAPVGDERGRVVRFLEGPTVKKYVPEWVHNKMSKYIRQEYGAPSPHEYGLRAVDDYRSPEHHANANALETFGLLESGQKSAARNGNGGNESARGSVGEHTSRSSDGSTGSGDAKSTQAPQITIQLLAACLFQLPMGIIWSTIGLIVLPYEAERFYPQAHSGFLGVLLTIAGTSQIVSPIVGRLSDDHRSIFGRRRPFMIYGTMLLAVGVAGLGYSSGHGMVVTYSAALFVSQVGLNVIYSATVLGLVPDVLEAQGLSGTNASASGIIAIFGFLGNLLGMVFMMGTASMAMRNVYPFYLVSVLVTAAMVWICCPEESSMNRKRTRKDEGAGFYKALLLDARQEPDFFWVFVGRTLYYLSISCLSFIYYFVRDVGGVTEEATRKWYVALIVVCAQTTGALTAYPAGILSDSVGRKRLVYLSCVMMGLCYFSYLAIPFIPAASTLHPLLLGSCIYGVAAGCYMSVDYALALDCLPSKDTKGSSEALGLWGISGFIGSYIGPMAGGGLLEVFGATVKKDHYSYPGYVALLSAGGLMAMLSAWVTSYIKKAK